MNSSHAQFVSIPDSNFRNYLLQEIPSCFNASQQLDTSCSGVLNLTTIQCPSRNIYSLEGLQYFHNLTYLNCNTNGISSLPALSNTLTSIDCYFNYLTGLPTLPSNITNLRCDHNNISVWPTLPGTLTHFECQNNNLYVLPDLPNSISYLKCDHNNLTSLPSLPSSLLKLWCGYNHLVSLPALPGLIRNLECQNNDLTSLPVLPNSLSFLTIDNNHLTSLPVLPNTLGSLACNYNDLVLLPALPVDLQYLSCNDNKLTSLPTLPSGLTYLTLHANQIHCLPYLPNSLTTLGIDVSAINCLPNATNASVVDSNLYPIQLPVCNSTNNINHCQPFPSIRAFVYTDNNVNQQLDAGEFPKRNIQVNLSNNFHSFTAVSGNAQLNADSLGTYTVSAGAPAFYSVVPTSYTHHFNSYDTTVLDSFALVPIVSKDSLLVKISPVNRFARPGFSYVYQCEYENTGTAFLSPTLSFQYDHGLLSFDSSNNSSITQTGNIVNLSLSNLVPGQYGSLLLYFTVHSSDTIGTILRANASIVSNTTIASDSSLAIISASMDPNDKQATPNLSVAEVADDNHWVNYTIHFQNTGNDTAFSVVVTDTLDISKLQISSVQLSGTSHDCKITQKDNVLYFEFLNINLPDKATDFAGSNGFVNFRVKPLTTLVSGNVIPNKAFIYFDYNSPIETNTANTFINSTVPLTLLNISAIPQENNKIMVYWNTLSEINTKYFIIEQSEHGSCFSYATMVNAIGNGDHVYSCTIPQDHVYYIRLKMVDNNGMFTYSRVVSIRNNQSENEWFNVLSPTKKALNVTVYSNELENTKGSIVDQKGVLLKSFLLQKGVQQINIDSFPGGVYYLTTLHGVKAFMVE